MGDENEIENIKKDIKKSRITKEVTLYNKEIVETYKNAKDGGKTKREIGLQRSYTKSYEIVLKCLLRGEKIFSLENIIK